MNNKNLMGLGLILVGLAGAYYFYNKKKGNVTPSIASSIVPKEVTPMPKVTEASIAQKPVVTTSSFQARAIAQGKMADIKAKRDAFNTSYDKNLYE